MIIHIRYLRLGLLRRSHFDLLACPDSDQHQYPCDIVSDQIQHLAEQLERFALVFLLRIFLGITAQVNALTEVIQCRKMLAPVGIHALQHDAALVLGKSFLADQINLSLVKIINGFQNMLKQIFIGQRFRFLKHGRQRNIELPLGLQLFFKPFNIPLLLNGFFRHIRPEKIGKSTMPQRCNQLGRIFHFKQFITLLINDLALVIGYIIIFQQLLAHIEIAPLDFPLCRFNGSGHDSRFDRLAFRHFQPFHDRPHLVTGKNPQQRIIQRQIESRGTRIALAGGSSSQLIVHPA